MLKFKTINSITVILLLLVILLNMSYWYLIILLFLWCVVTIIGSFNIKWNYHLNSLNSNYSIENNYIGLTFDDGPNEEFTPQVLKLLKAHNAKATFFCIGKHIKQHPELFQNIIDEGHTVGNHTYTHDKQFGFFNTKRVVSELFETSTVIKNASGLNVVLFRPPYGVTNPSIANAVKKSDLKSIGWSVRTLDTTSKSKKSIIESVQRKVKKGDVILLHDTSTKSIEVLEQLLVLLKEKQLESVTIPTLFNIKAYA